MNYTEPVVPADHVCYTPGCWQVHGDEMHIGYRSWGKHCTLPRLHSAEGIPCLYAGRLKVARTRERTWKDLKSAAVGVASGLACAYVVTVVPW